MNKALSGSHRALALLVVLLGGCAGALNLPTSARPQSYTVRRGDTLYAIAWHYGLYYRTVARWNGISYPYTIHPGERIYLHPHHAVSRSKSRAVGHKAPEAAKTYPLRQGSGADTSAVRHAPENTNLRWQWPAKGAVRASFGENGIAGKGIVIEGELGEPVRAAADGTVVYAGDALVGYGRLVIVKHNDEWLSAYAHNQRLLVHEGQTVEGGEELATMGVAPDGKSELYFEIRKDGKPVNPLHFLSSRR
ncbi:MAG: peptidoglycan DD-metalloendopeptidase family protein [Gammaproteobacteria bacterium]